MRQNVRMTTVQPGVESETNLHPFWLVDRGIDGGHPPEGMSANYQLI